MFLMKDANTIERSHFLQCTVGRSPALWQPNTCRPRLESLMQMRSWWYLSSPSQCPTALYCYTPQHVAKSKLFTQHRWESLHIEHCRICLKNTLDITRFFLKVIRQEQTLPLLEQSRLQASQTQYISSTWMISSMWCSWTAQPRSCQLSLLWDLMPSVSDISEASHRTPLAPGQPLLICLILSAGKGSEAKGARSALVSHLLLWCSHLLALKQISREEVGK